MEATYGSASGLVPHTTTQSKVLSAARDYQQKGYVVLPVKLWEQDGGKGSKFLPSWSKAKLEDCLDLFAQLSDCNGLAIKTGEESDLIAVDGDRLKPKDAEAGLLDGVEVMNNKFQEHGDDSLLYVPAKTGSDGRHWLFSLSKSKAAGLVKQTNNAKLIVGGQRTTIDIRGEGGCIFAAPSAYGNKSYTFLTDVPSSQDLQAMPAWLIDIVNGTTKGKRVSQKRQPEDKPSAQIVRHRNEDATSKEVSVTASDVLEEVTPLVEGFMGATIKKWYPRPYGGDFHVAVPVMCPICHCMHDKNSTSCRVIFGSQVVILKNYSTQCHNKAVGWNAVACISELWNNPTSDLQFVKLFVEAIRPCQYVYYERVGAFLKHDGAIWKQASCLDLGQEIIGLATNFLKQLTICLAEEMAHLGIDMSQKRSREMHKELTEPWTALRKALSYVQKASAIDSIIAMAKYVLHDAELTERMDADPDLLGCQNGVLHLSTGQLRPAGEDYVSQQTACDWRGLDQETPMIDSFMSDIFNGDMDLIGFMQRFMGYCLTGHDRSQVWAIFSGSGANGKGVLNEMMKTMMGPYAVDMHGDCMFKTGRSSAAGAAESHMIALINKRWAVRDESDSDDVLNEKMVKRMTGGGHISARDLNKPMTTFKPTFKPILMTNNRPKIDVSSDAMRRRILVIAFPNRYKPAQELDSTDPMQKLRDDNMQAKMTTREAQEQLLVWCVKGAMQWYQQGIGDIPKAIAEAKASYYEENDDIGSFISDHCTKAANASVSVTEFKNALESSGIRKTSADIKKHMESKGFLSVKTRGPRVWMGIALASEIV